MNEPTSAKIAKDPAIARELKMLEENITMLDDTAGTLFGKIATVVRCEPEIAKDKQSSPDLPCEMANTLSCFSRRINAVREQVERQISVIEL